MARVLFLSTAMIGFVVLAAVLSAVQSNDLTEPIKYIPDRWISEPTDSHTHCMSLLKGRVRIAWTVNLDNGQSDDGTLAYSLSAQKNRGFVGIGYSEHELDQIVTGRPASDLTCARALYDSGSIIDDEGEIYPTHIESPSTTSDDSRHVYFTTVSTTRNLTMSAREFLHRGHAVATNLTLLWAYRISSAYDGECSEQTEALQYTERTTISFVFGDSTYLRPTTGTAMCREYDGEVTGHRGSAPLDTTRGFLAGERDQSHRTIMGLLGGDMLLRAGKKGPQQDLVTGFVRVGEGGNGKCQQTRSYLMATWSGFFDPIGGIHHYEISFGDHPDRVEYYLNRRDVGTQTSVSIPTSEAIKGSIDGSGQLPMNSTLVARLRVVAASGAFLDVTSTPVIVLNDGAPLWGTVSANSGGSYQQATTTIAATWTNWVAEDHEYNGYTYAAYSHTDASYLNSFASTTGTTVTVSSLTLEHGKQYAVVVRSTNCAGLTTEATSNSVTVDIRGPYGGRVFFGNTTTTEPHTTVSTFRYLQVHDPLEISWYGFQDAHSGVASYEVAFTTTADAPYSGNSNIVVDWTSASTLGLTVTQNGDFATYFATTSPSTLYGLTSSLTSPAITAGTTVVYAHVRAADNVGNLGIASSNSTLVATT